MKFFISSSKQKAKERLIVCIKSDREALFDKNAFTKELEKLFVRYTKVDGPINVRIVKGNKNKRYIQAEACIKI